MSAGRPTSLTPEVRARIIAAIQAGNYRDTACRAAGVTDRSLRNWCERGEAGEEPYATFLADLGCAEANAEMDLLAEIKAAQPSITGEGGSGPTPWQSRAWIMERRWPKRWAARIRTAVAEEVDTLTHKLRSKPALAAEVAHVLAAEGGDAGSGAPH